MHWRREQLKKGTARFSLVKPLISIVIPVWNGEKFLRPAVESILGQTFADFELIVVDDGSDDGTAEILGSYRDKRLQIHRLAHEGIVKALNFGVAQARADWIARQDADDVSLPKRLQRQWEAIQRNPGAVLCFTGHSMRNEGPERIGPARLPQSRSFLALRLCYQCPFAHSTVLFSKEAFHVAGGYREAERHAEDYALWGRMLQAGEFIGLPQKFLKLRVHEGSVSRQNLETQTALTLRIAVQNCQRFMALGAAEAERAANVLRTAGSQRQLKDWIWFLTRCVPGLRWKSAETMAWLMWQTAKQLAGI